MSAAAAGAPSRRRTLGKGVVLSGLTVAVLALAPLVCPTPILGALEKGLVAALFALAFNLLAGQAGMLSFGHAAYFATGSFATVQAMVAIEHGELVLPTPLLPIVGATAGLAAGVVAGYLATLRSGVYFSMVTLAIAEFLHTIAPNLKGVFGGETGISSFRQPFGPWSFGSDAEVYILTLCWVVLSAALLYGLGNTLFGRLTIALRENERRLPALGYNVHGTKVVIFAMSGLFSGLAGGLLAIQTESANYVLFNIGVSTAVVLNTIIGGTGLFLGPAFGAMVITLFGYLTSDVTRMWLLYEGLIFIAIMLLAPTGLLPLLLDGAARGRHSGQGMRRTVLFLIALLLAIGCVQVVEMLSALTDRDYQGMIQRGMPWPPVVVLGHAWSPGQAWTWLLPVGAIACGCALAMSARSCSRRAVP